MCLIVMLNGTLHYCERGMWQIFVALGTGLGLYCHLMIFSSFNSQIIINKEWDWATGLLSYNVEDVSVWRP